jgi:hypothetical protein
MLGTLRFAQPTGAAEATIAAELCKINRYGFRRLCASIPAPPAYSILPF